MGTMVLGSIDAPGEFPLLMIVTDRASVPEDVLLERLARAPAPVVVQLREKEARRAERSAFGKRLMAAIGEHLLLVNGDVELALALGAHGVHLPATRSDELPAARARLGEARVISVACHDVSEVERAAQSGANAALLSPIFESPGKSAPLGLDALGPARERIERAGSSCRLIALGGVDDSNASACLHAGAHGVAAIRADLGPWLARLG